MAIITVASPYDHVNVQNAVNAAAHGDTIQIPDCVVSWDAGVTVNKRVIIRAQNSAPVQYGRTNQSVVITNTAPVGTALFSLTTGDDYHTGLRGIKFIESTLGQHVRASGTGSKVAFLNDCYFDYTERFGAAPTVASINWEAQGGIWYNTYFYSTRNLGAYGGDTNYVKSPRAWTSAPTMGTADTNGTINLYIEDCSIIKNTTFIDMDTNARVVTRHCNFDGSNFAHHGLTSNPGARHSEWYNNTFSNTFALCNIGAVYMWIRGGTTVMMENVANNAAYPGDYGAPILIKIGEHDDIYGSYPPTTTPAQYMAGWGHNGSAFVSDPIFVWGNTGDRAATYGWTSTYWSNMTALNRDFFLNATSLYPPNGARPGYAKYTYPHPLRATLDGDSQLTRILVLSAR